MAGTIGFASCARPPLSRGSTGFVLLSRLGRGGGGGADGQCRGDDDVSGGAFWISRAAVERRQQTSHRLPAELGDGHLHGGERGRQRAIGTSSKPTRETSSGTRSPRSRKAARQPIAMASLAAKIAVGRGISAATLAPACSPDSSPKSPASSRWPLSAKPPATSASR